MLLKVGETYICLRDVKAFELGVIQVGHDDVARLTVTFYMIPKPLTLTVELGRNLSQEEMTAMRGSFGKRLAELIAEAKKNVNSCRVVDVVELTRVSKEVKV